MKPMRESPTRDTLRSMAQRQLDELIEKADPAWPLVQGWVAASSNRVEVLPVERGRADAALVALQVTTRSPMGAIVHESGGLLIDDGWLRILGSGSARLPRSLPDWNAERIATAPGAPPPCLLIADDALGGFFAIDYGSLSGNPGKVHYLAPDGLEWENLDASYTSFLSFVLSADLEDFYQGLRWPGWHEELAGLRGDRAISVVPFLWTQGPAIAERSRRPVPVAELWDLKFDVLRQLRTAK